MVDFFSFCCGEGDEESKYGAVVDLAMAKKLGWTTDAETHKQSEHANMPNFEKQISILLERRPEIEDTEQKSRPSSGHAEDRGFRSTIFGRPHSMCPTKFTLTVIPKEVEDIEFLEAAIRSNILFLELTADVRREFIDGMESESVPADHHLIVKGGVGDYFYVLAEGTMDFLDDNGATIDTAHPGASFGEHALLYDAPRIISCVTTSPCVLWKADRRLFQYCLARHSMHDHRDLKLCLRNVALFENLDERTLDRFVKLFTPVHFSEGTRIVQKGEEGKIFYVIQQGQVKEHDMGFGDSATEDIIHGPGDWFGEQALLLDINRNSNVTAVTETTTMVINRATFEKCVGPLQHLLDRSLREKRLQTMPVFSDISKPEIAVLANLMQELCFVKGKHLAHAGEPYEPNLYIIRAGRLLVYSEEQDELFNLAAGDFFGDKSIKGEGKNVSAHTVVCQENLTVWMLSRKNIESVVGDIERLGKIEAFRKIKTQDTISFSELRHQRLIGKGGFGSVWLVSHDNKNGGTDSYALKTISKALLVDSKLHKTVLHEKDLLGLLNHPFILRLVDSYQDATHLYLLMPLVLGGELYDALVRSKTPGQGMNNDSAAFYCACIIEALGYMHRRDIAYRDLKLENVLIDQEGYCKIIDLGFAKVVSGKTFTICGTTEYLAPEILLSKGHDHAVDYWAFGVLMFELLVGRTPFYKPNSSQLDTFKRIIQIDYECPEYVDFGFRDLLSRLLVRPQTSRLGNLAKGHIDVKLHPWFPSSGIDFRELLGKDIVPPWKPDVADIIDPTKFNDLQRDRNTELRRTLTLAEQELFQGF